MCVMIGRFGFEFESFEIYWFRIGFYNIGEIFEIEDFIIGRKLIVSHFVSSFSQSRL